MGISLKVNFTIGKTRKAKARINTTREQACKEDIVCYTFIIGVEGGRGLLMCILKLVQFSKEKIFSERQGIILTILSGSDTFWNKGHGGVWSRPPAACSASPSVCPVQPPSHSQEKSVWKSPPSSEPWQTQHSEGSPKTPGKWLMALPPESKGIG